MLMKKILIIVVLALLAMPAGVSALVTYSGNTVNIIDPVNDVLPRCAHPEMPSQKPLFTFL